MIKNNLKYWQHQLQMNQTEFCAFLEYKNVGRYNQFYNYPEKNNPNTETMYKFWLKIKEKYPKVNLQDMWIYTPSE